MAAIRERDSFGLKIDSYSVLLLLRNNKGKHNGFVEGFFKVALVGNGVYRYKGSKGVRAEI